MFRWDHITVMPINLVVEINLISLVVQNMETITVFGPKHGSPLSLPSRTNMCWEMKPSRFPLTSVRGKPAKQVGLKVSASCDRPISKLPPSKWTNYFHSVLVDVSVSLV